MKRFALAVGCAFAGLLLTPVAAQDLNIINDPGAPQVQGASAAAVPGSSAASSTRAWRFMDRG